MVFAKYTRRRAAKQTSPAPYDIVMLVLNDVAHDRRVRTEAMVLGGAGRRVLVIGTQRAEGALPDREQWPGVEVRRVRYGRWGARLWRPWRWVRHGLQLVMLLRALWAVEARAWHAHDLPALMVMMAARTLGRRRAAVVYDSHELYLFMPVKEMTGRWHRLTRPAFLALEGVLARRCAAVLTVSATCARALRRWHRLREVIVVQNAIDPVPGAAESPLAAVRAIKARGNVCLIHSGEITDRGRALTELVEAMALLPDKVELVFLGKGEALPRLQALTRARGVDGRVHWERPVAPEEVPTALSGADVAMVLLRTDSWHIRATLPVKLFEAVAAGLPIVASAEGALGRMVRHYELGVTCQAADPAAVAEAIRRGITPEAQHYFREKIRQAQAKINGQTEAQILVKMYDAVLGESS